MFDLITYMAEVSQIMMSDDGQQWVIFKCNKIFSAVHCSVCIQGVTEGQDSI